MNCIYCGGDTQVVNSRTQKRSNGIWRRRQCKNCHGVFTTQETADFALSWAFKAKNGALMPFMRERLLVSLYDSLRHRPTALDDATALTGTILNKLLPLVTTGTIDRGQLVNAVATTLERFDAAAAVSYRAFHP